MIESKPCVTRMGSGRNCLGPLGVRSGNTPPPHPGHLTQQERIRDPVEGARRMLRDDLIQSRMTRAAGYGLVAKH